MNIFNQQYNSNSSNNSVTTNNDRGYNSSSVSGSYNVAKINSQSQVNKASSINNLIVGQVFKGEITDVQYNSVTILLDNLSKMTATLKDSVDVNIGDTMYFEVKEKNDEKMFIKPLEDNKFDAQNQTIEKVLNNNGFLMTEKNMTVVNQLMNRSMPVDRDSILKIIQQSYKNENADIKTLVAMTKLNIPITNENIEQYEKYTNYNHSISSAIGDISNELGNIFNKIPNDYTREQLEELNNKIINIIVSSEEIKSEIEINKNIIPNPSNNNQIRSDLEEIDKIFSNNNATNDITKEVLKQQSDIKNSVLDTDLKQQLFNQVSKLDISEKSILRAYASSENNTELLKNINELINSQEIKDTVKLKDLLGSKEYRQLISDTIKDKLLINPEKTQNVNDVKKVYDKIYDTANKIINIFENQGKISEDIVKTGVSIKENVEFINELNNMFNYTQLPLKLNNKETNSELYVYSNKKNNLNNGESSALLHLDMDNLGPIDIHVTLRDSKVFTRFYLNDQESIEVISDNIGQLEEKLKEKGYSLTSDLIKKDEESNSVIDNMLEVNSSEENVKRYNFDVRM